MAVAACGRARFDPIGDATVDAKATDGEASRCNWVGGPKLDQLIDHPELNSPAIETDPLLVRGDPLTMYVSSVRAGTSDIYVAHRPALYQPFEPPVLLTELNTTTSDENGLEVDTSGRGFCSSSAAGNYDLYEVARPAPGQPFAIVRALTELNDTQPQLDAFPSTDGLELWYSTIGASTAQDIMIAKRSDRTQPFGAPVPFVYNTASAEAGATLTDDGLVVVWINAASEDIFYATRPTVSDPWSAPQVLAPGIISTTEIESEPSIRGDGCELFFIRIENGADWNIHAATFAP